MLKYTKELENNFHDMRCNINGIINALDDLKDFTLNNNKDEVARFVMLLGSTLDEVNDSWKNINTEFGNQLNK